MSFVLPLNVYGGCEMGYTSHKDYRESIDSDAHGLINDYVDRADVVGISGLPSGSDLLGWDSVMDALHGMADSECTYHSTCADILRYSNNSNAAFNHMGDDALHGCKSTEEVNTRLAYYAYYEDLAQGIHGIGSETVAEILEIEECEECGEVFDTVPRSEAEEKERAEVLHQLDPKELCGDCRTGEDEEDD